MYISSKEIESVIEKPNEDSFISEFYQMLKADLIPVLFKL